MTGLILTIVGLTMVARSRTASFASLAQASRVRSLAATEGGFSRILATLNGGSFNQLLVQDLENWADFDYIPHCFDEAELQAEVLAGEIGTGGQSFEIVDYQYNEAAQQGSLTLAGTADLSSSQVTQTISIRGTGDDSTADFPALIGILDIDLGNNNILGVDANVICSDRSQCVVPCTGPDGAFAGEPDLRSAIGAGSQSVIAGDIFVGPVDLPNVPSLPAGSTTINLGDIDFGGQSQVNGVTVTLTDSRYTLPQPGDRASLGLTPGDIIYYEVDDIDIQGNRELAIDTSEGPVYFYLTGDIDIRGNAGIIHESPTNAPADFRIYGADTTGTPPTTEQVISLSGNSCMDAFVFAPNAVAGIKGGGNCGANINGAVWVRRWTNRGPVGSNSTTANITVPVGLPEQLADLNVDVAYASGDTLLWRAESVGGGSAIPTIAGTSTVAAPPIKQDDGSSGGSTTTSSGGEDDD